MKPVEKTVVPMSAAQLAEYTGEYDIRGGTNLEVRVVGDHLLLGRRGDVLSALQPEAADQFFFPMTMVPR